MKRYAKNTEQAINYFKCEYVGFDGTFSRNGFGFADNDICIRRGSCHCGCGENIEYWAETMDGEILETVVECEGCYNAAPYMQQLD